MEMFQKVLHLPPIWAEHKTKNVKGDRGITRQQSKQLFYETQMLVPIASRTLRIPFMFFFTLFGRLSFEFIMLAICKSCRLRLTRADTKSTESIEPPELGESSKVDIININTVLICDECLDG